MPGVTEGLLESMRRPWAHPGSKQHPCAGKTPSYRFSPIVGTKSVKATCVHCKSHWVREGADAQDLLQAWASGDRAGKASLETAAEQLSSVIAGVIG